MMITQLQNQDPLDPTDSQDILSQMSEIGQLQSSDQLQTSLTGLVLQNQIGSSSSLIGKSVQGIDASNNQTAGVVTGVSVNQNANTVSLTLDNGDTLPLTGVSSITQASTTSSSGIATSAAVQTNTSSPVQDAANAVQNAIQQGAQSVGQAVQSVVSAL
jgi:flagellar basal-body rod modification protein FlgD